MSKDDIYKDKLKALFSDFETDIPSDGWDKLEESLGLAKRATIVRRNWYIGSAAAVASILITGILFINNPKQIDTFTPQLTEATQKIDDSQNNTNINEQTQQDASDMNITETLVAKHTPSKPILKEEFVIDDSDVEIPFQPSTPPTVKSEKEETHSDNKKNNKQLSKEDIEQQIKELQNAANANIFDFEEDNTNKKPIMMAVNARGGLLSSQQEANTPIRLRSASNDKSNNNSDSKDKSNLASDENSIFVLNNNLSENEAELNHYQPVSVGITVSKEIIPGLSIETGLVYSYLYSKAKNSGASYDNRESQQLHYLGIPLNLNYNFVNIGNVGLFVSAGGMIEKDIYGKYMGRSHASIENNPQQFEGNMSKNIKFKHPQYSVNAGFGATYPISRGIDMYAKIGGAYYFEAKNIDKNNFHYSTIYSDKKIMLDLNAGIRFNF